MPMVDGRCLDNFRFKHLRVVEHVSGSVSVNVCPQVIRAVL